MNIVKNGLKTMSSVIIASIISFFLCISMLNICTGIFTTEIGYDAFVYENETSEKSIAKYTYLYTDENGDGEDEGIDIKKEEYEDKGYVVVTSKKRSNLSGGGKMVFWGTTQILSAIMVIAFASSSAYKQGFKDSNLVRIGHIKKDKLKGFKIGLIANIPFFIVFAIAVIKASVFRKTLYAFLNANFYAIIMAITGADGNLSQIGVGKFFLLGLLLIIVPVISGVGYILGIKEINLREKIVYKKR